MNLVNFESHTKCGKLRLHFKVQNISLTLSVSLQGEMGLPGIPGSTGQPGPKVAIHVFAL